MMRLKFTGLYDHKGKKIYDGDIVRYGDGTEYEVFYDDEFRSFRLRNSSDIHDIDKDEAFYVVVVGNVNEELFKGELE